MTTEPTDEQITEVVDELAPSFDLYEIIDRLAKEVVRLQAENERLIGALVAAGVPLKVAQQIASNDPEEAE